MQKLRPVSRQLLAQLRCRNRVAASLINNGKSLNTSFVAARSFSSSPAMAKISTGLDSELKYEKENYTAGEVQVPAGWKLSSTPGDVNLYLEKDLAAANKSVRIEWQLRQPTPWEDNGEGENALETEDTATEFTITVSSNNSEAGMVFYCTTQAGEEHRYIMGNVKSFSTTAERDNPSAYNGPDFEDLDEKVIEPLDEFLTQEIGLSDEVCDYIDAAAVDKEKQEYIRWLDNMKKFFAA